MKCRECQLPSPMREVFKTDYQMMSSGRDDIYLSRIMFRVCVLTDGGCGAEYIVYPSFGPLCDLIEKLPEGAHVLAHDPERSTWVIEELPVV